MVDILEFERKYIENSIANAPAAPLEVTRAVSQKGIVQNIKEWADMGEAYVWQTQNLGRMGFKDYENAKGLDPKWTSKTVTLMTLSGKLSIRTSELAQARDNMLGVKKGLQEIISTQLQDFKRQIEGMVINGDASRYQASGDPKGKTNGYSQYPGLFNGTDGTHLTVIAGGTGANNNMAANGAYYDTIVTAIATAGPEGIDTSVGDMFLDWPTACKLQKSRNAYGIQEIDMIHRDFPGINIWATDAILEKESDDVYSDMHKICFLFPFAADGTPMVKYYISKALHVQPLWGGGLTDSGCYEWMIGYKGGVIAKNEHASLITGDLTIA